MNDIDTSSEIEAARQRITELESILRQFVQQFDGAADGVPLSECITCGPFFRAKEALGLIPKRQRRRQSDSPVAHSAGIRPGDRVRFRDSYGVKGRNEFTVVSIETGHYCGSGTAVKLDRPVNGQPVDVLFDSGWFLPVPDRK